MSVERRAALEAAFEQAESSGGGEAEAEAVPEAPVVEPVESAPEPEESGPLQAEATEPAEEPSGERPRGPDGKFLPKPKAEPAAKQAASKPQETPAPAQAKAPTPPAPKAGVPAPEALKPPQSWKPAARELWASLPPAVQAEAVRIDSEVRKVMQESAPARKFAQAFEQVVAPYRAIMTAEPLQVVQNLMQTAAQLQTAPPAQRGALVAQIIKTYGVDVQAVADALDGKAPAQPQQPEYRDPRLDHLLAKIEAAQRHGWVSEAESWLKQQEFGEDVRQRMGRLMAAAAQDGVAMSLEDAYNEACWATPQVREVLQRREAAKLQGTATAATQKAKAAAVSVVSEPAAGPAPEDSDKSRRALLRRAFASHGR